MKLRSKRIVWLVLALIGVGLLAYAFVPTPVAVDSAVVGQGPMQVTVNQEGKTRVRDRYMVSATLAGDLDRIELKAGDRVQAGRTILARIRPSWPVLLDVRAREQAEAAVRAAQSAVDQAQPQIGRAEAELDHAISLRRRRQQLATSNASSQQELEDAQLAVAVAEAQLKSNRAALQVANFQLEQAKAAMLSVTSPATTRPAVFDIRSPIDGQVLRVIQESAAAVTPGAQLIELGDVSRIETVIDVLSRDAVKVQPGAKVYFDGWGGDRPLLGTVRRIEPSGFTKISALGVEEQRVNVIADVVLPENALALGDYFRVDARIVIWERPDALQVPSGALFRHDDGWAVYRIENGRAALREIQVGRQSGTSAEVLGGIAAGDRIVIHPSDKVTGNVRVTERARGSTR